MAASSPTKRYVRLIVGVALLSTLIFAARRYSQNIPDCSAIQAQITDWGALAPVGFFLVYVLSTVAFIPGILVTMLAGLAFGSFWGTVIVSISSTAGATLAFLGARYIARDAVEGFLSKQAWFAKFKAGIQADGFNYVLFVRLVPLFPFNGLNYACGLTPLKLKDYVIGSMIGMLPGTFAYVYLGETGCKLIDPVIQGRFSLKDFPPDVRNSLLIAILLLAGLSVLPILLKKFKKQSPAPSNG
jgi:uncharacterized membrane protein YdjX (TVP38/TMEM64 family)